MIASPFAGALPPKPRSLWQRLTRQPDSAAAAGAIAALFADRPPSEVPSSAVSEALVRFGVTGKTVRPILDGLWTQALTASLADDALTDDEIAFLERLVYLFDLDCDRVDQSL